MKKGCWRLLILVFLVIICIGALIVYVYWEDILDFGNTSFSPDRNSANSNSDLPEPTPPFQQEEPYDVPSSTVSTDPKEISYLDEFHSHSSLHDGLDIMPGIPLPPNLDFSYGSPMIVSEEEYFQCSGETKKVLHISYQRHSSAISDKELKYYQYYMNLAGWKFSYFLNGEFDEWLNEGNNINPIDFVTWDYGLGVVDIPISKILVFNSDPTDKRRSYGLCDCTCNIAYIYATQGHELHIRAILPADWNSTKPPQVKSTHIADIMYLAWRVDASYALLKNDPEILLRDYNSILAEVGEDGMNWLLRQIPIEYEESDTYSTYDARDIFQDINKYGIDNIQQIAESVGLDPESRLYQDPYGAIQDISEGNSSNSEILEWIGFPLP